MCRGKWPEVQPQIESGQSIARERSERSIESKERVNIELIRRNLEEIEKGEVVTRIGKKWKKAMEQECRTNRSIGNRCDV